MPIPKPIKGEQQSKYISRCISAIVGEYESNKQAAAVCFTTWRRSKRKNRNDENEGQDIREISIIIDENQNKYRIDEETGFMYVDAFLTRSGVFNYFDDDGNLIREYRPPEEVFSKESLDSLKLKPITDQHPKEMVSVDNIKELQVGMIGNDIKKEGLHVKGEIVLTDKDTIETVINRKKYGLTTELSCGYSCELEKKDGIHISEGDYQYIQHNIKYNHCSIVDSGRAGETVRILDQNNNKNNKKENKMPDKVMVLFQRKQFKNDCLEINSISKEVCQDDLGTVTYLNDSLDHTIELVSKLDSDNKIIKQENKDIKNKLDELQGKYDENLKNIEQLKKDLEDARNINSVNTKAMFDDYNNVCNVANNLKVDTKNKSIKEIKIDCIKSINENIDLTDKTDAYIDGRFDNIIDQYNEKIKTQNADNLGNFINNSKNVSGEKKLSPREIFLQKDAEQRKNK